MGFSFDRVEPRILARGESGTFGNTRGAAGNALCLLALFCAGAVATAQPAAADDPPPRERKVYAHHMGSLNVGRGAMAHHAENPRLGDFYFSNGGDYRSLALAPRTVNRLSLEQSADLQIRRAMAIGLDGFAVNAWAGRKEARDFLHALFRVAEEKDYPFEISICPDEATLEQPDGYRAAFVGAIRYLLDNHGDSPKLARRDGKPIIFGYQSMFLWVDYLWREYGNQAEVDRMRTTPEGWATIREAFREVEEEVGQELFFQFDMGAFFHGVQVPIPDRMFAEAAAAVARQFPAVNQFLPNRHTLNIAQAVIAEGAEWGHPIYLNYDNNRISTSHGGPGTAQMRQRWKEARDLGSTLIQYTTWNDYHENTNLSPGTNTRYAYYHLSGFFIDWWKTGQQPELDRDRLYLFSRKYPPDVKTFPFRAPNYLPGAIEVLTLLREPATIRVPGRAEPFQVPAGLHVAHFPVTPGPVSAEVVRGGDKILSLEVPEPVTDRPFRQDNGIVGISSECARLWEQEFGSARGLYDAEYGDADGDGLPNWFEMLWFGKFNDYSTATVAQPDGVVHPEGLTNLEVYLRHDQSPAGDDFVPEQLFGPFHGIPAKIPGLLQAQDYDHGGPGVAYFDTTVHNNGGAYRPHESVDIQPSNDETGFYNIGWIISGEWLEYTVEVEKAGYYDVAARVASPNEGRTFHIQMDGKDVTGSMEVPRTGHFQSWQTITAPKVYLAAGVRKMRVRMNGSGFNLNYFEFLPSVPETQPGAWIISPEDGRLFREGDAIEIATGVEEGSPARVFYYAGEQLLGETTVQPHRWVWRNAPAGSHDLRIESVDTDGIRFRSPIATVEVKPADAGLPYGGKAASFPGLIRAMHYDLGGPGVAYVDTVPRNQGQGFRMDEHVDLEQTSDIGGGFNIGWIEPGEWVSYTVRVDKTTHYNLRLRVASPHKGKFFNVEIDGEDVTDRIDVPQTGAWQQWTTVTVPGVPLTAGLKHMRVKMGSGGFNLNSIEAQEAVAASPDGYAAWVATHFSAAEAAMPAVSGRFADPDGDGIPNLAEYALGGDPRRSDRGRLPRPRLVSAGGQTYLGIEYRRPAALVGLTYQVELSENLREWSPAEAVAVSVTAQGAEEVVIVRDSQPISQRRARYMRLRIIPVP
jgi:hypothetical protein